MAITHLVISGGGAMGLRFLGVLRALHARNVWSKSDLRSIHATSIGSVVAVVLCLGYEAHWDDVETYFAERPWSKSLALSGQHVLGAFRRKGLFGIEAAETLLEPLLAAKGLTLTTTLAEFQALCPNLRLVMYTCELHRFETVALSAASHPELLLTQAITMSCGLPGLVQPVLYDGGCYVDGGMSSNVPVNECMEGLAEGESERNVLVVTWRQRKATATSTACPIDDDTDLVDYALYLCSSAIRYITETSRRTQHGSVQAVVCWSADNPMEPKVMAELLASKDVRRAWLRDFAEGDADTLGLLSESGGAS
jgi:predicted acylesterase/phospholipase RssA